MRQPVSPALLIALFVVAMVFFMMTVLFLGHKDWLAGGLSFGFYAAMKWLWWTLSHPRNGARP